MVELEVSRKMKRVVKRLKTEKNPVIVEIDENLITIKDATTGKGLLSFKASSIKIEENMVPGRSRELTADGIVKMKTDFANELNDMQGELADLQKKAGELRDRLRDATTGK
jgi:uncharacterized protein YeeX (DUF496 family)